jgi:hypothetical protein
MIIQQGTRVCNAQGGLFSKWCWEKWMSTCKSVKLNPYLIPHTKTNSKWIKDLKGRPRARKCLEETMGENLHDTKFDDNFLVNTQKALSIKGTTLKESCVNHRPNQQTEKTNY